MLNASELKKLYSRYGFDITNDPESNSILIFLYTKSRYYGADIVPLDANSKTVEKATKIKEKYSSIGYASQVKEYDTLISAEEELFKSFFSFESSSKRTERKYQDFTNRITKNLGYKYQYISAPFDIEGNYDKVDDILACVKSLVKKETPQLIIIEAAAGYGKTCTAYEILNLLSSTNSCSNPLFTELSRNRSAKIFRYILLDEIDIEYPTLNSELVKAEIESGRIPLIIDGFDELLTKQSSNSIKDSSFDLLEEVESMLDTIGNLLLGKAKVILTSRKTAIFSGDEFNSWQKKWDNKFEVTRLSIKEPMVIDWLGEEKHGLIKSHNIPIQNISNPVLLTFLRSLSTEKFGDYLNNPDKLVDTYFNALLDREKERQNLPMASDVQYQIFKKVTKLMIELDTASESREFFKEIFIEENKKDLEQTRQIYSPQERPSLEQLADTLTSHALLDRKTEDNFIGFINDFIFGNLIADVLCEENDELIQQNTSTYMIELAITSCRVQPNSKKSILWNKIGLIKDKLPSNILFIGDIYLKNKILNEYKDAVFNSYNIYDVIFTEEFPFESCVFINCTFKNCSFSKNAFLQTSFLECEFGKCNSVNNYDLGDDENNFVLKPKIKDCTILKSFTKFSDNYDFNKELEKEILKTIWVTSADKYSKNNLIQLANKFYTEGKEDVLACLTNLIDNRYISLHGKSIRIEINKVSEIREIIGL